jgi:hypothetical protein
MDRRSRRERSNGIDYIALREITGTGSPFSTGSGYNVVNRLKWKKLEVKKMPDTTAKRFMITPTAQIVELYAEYDDLLEALEAVQLQLQSESCRNQITHIKLRVQMHGICEALADVHERISDFVLM